MGNGFFIGFKNWNRATDRLGFISSKLQTKLWILLLLLLKLVDVAFGLSCLHCNSERNETGCLEGEMKWSKQCKLEPDITRGCYYRFNDDHYGEPSVWRGCMWMTFGPECHPLAFSSGKVCNCLTDNCNTEPYVRTGPKDSIESKDECVNTYIFWPWIVAALCSLVVLMIICTIRYRRYGLPTRNDGPSSAPLPSSADTSV